MSPAEPHYDDEGSERTRIEETFRRLARAPHAPADFHATVMARATSLSASRQRWHHRLFTPQIPGTIYLQRQSAMAFVGLLLGCLIGLGFLYQHVTQLQSTIQHERQLRHQQAMELAQLRQKLDARQPFARPTRGRMTQNESEDLSRTTLEINEPQPDIVSPPQMSLIAKISQFTKDALEVVTRFMARVWQDMAIAPDRHEDQDEATP
jgi:hypothetical protein